MNTPPRVRGREVGGLRRPRAASETQSCASGTVRVMEPVRSDVDCVAHSLSEPNAFELIFDRHYGSVHRYLHRRAGRDLADELAAETFALAFERRASCRATSTVLPWLYGIATNLLRHRRRAEIRQLRAYARSGVDRWAAYEDAAAGRVDGSPVDGRLAHALAAMRPRLHLFGHHHRFSEQEREGVRSVGLDLVSRSYLLLDPRTLDYQVVNS